VSLDQLTLREGQDMALVAPEALLNGSIWSKRLDCHRPLADGMIRIFEHVLLRR
jgi:hypothetical protein